MESAAAEAWCCMAYSKGVRILHSPIMLQFELECRQFGSPSACHIQK